MSSPLVSVIMSVYNTKEEFIKQSISSILNQTYTNFEFIIIDDASDNIKLPDIINEYNDSRIILLQNNKNLGLTKSLNIGIKKSKGKYIARMDSDDISLPERFSKQVKYLESNKNVGVLGTSAILFGGLNRRLQVATSHEKLKAKLIFDSPMYHPSVMIRKKILQNDLYNEEFKKGQDYELWSRLIWKTDFSNINESLLKYRIHKDQITNKHKLEQKTNANIVRERMMNIIDPSISREDLNIVFMSASGQVLNEQQLVQLKKISEKLYISNLEKQHFDKNELTFVLSENIDKSLFINARENNTFPVKNIKLNEIHVKNNYSLKKYFGKIYYQVKKHKKK